MKKSLTDVYIPILDLKGTEAFHSLINVYCQQQYFGETAMDDRAIDKDWDVTAAQLRKYNLYEDGLLAVNSVRKLELKKPLFALFQHFRKYSYLDNQRLYSKHVFRTEGESAQLGLALALLLNASNSQVTSVIATGKLSNEVRENPKHKNDTAVEEVGGIEKKLALVLSKRKSGDLGTAPLLYCFTPVYLDANKQEKIATLPIIKDLAEVGIVVKPIAWLSEAAKVLQANTARYLLWDILCQGVLIALVCLGLDNAWWHNPIIIKIMPGDHHKDEPFFVCSTSANQYSFYDLKRDGGIPLFPLVSQENETFNFGLGIKLKPEKTILTSAYYAIFIHLGEKTGMLIIDKQGQNGQAISTTADAPPLFMNWPMLETNSPAEDNVLLVAFQRTPIEVNKLKAEFKQHFPEDKPLKVLEARDFLLPQFPGSYAFLYRSIIAQPPCIDLSP